MRESGVFDAFSILTYKLKENRKVLIDNLIAQLERIQQRFGGAGDRIGDIDKEIAQLCAQSLLLAKLNNNGILGSAEYAEQAAEIENKIKTLRTERRKKLSENQDDEMLDELKTLRQILDEYKPHAEFDETLFEIIVKRIEVVNNSQLCFKLLGDIELTETINRKARCKQREAQDNPVWV